MSESTILELRQKDSSDIERNGIYKTTLDSAIQIEEGDQVNVKAIYLDTSESSAGLIHLEDPVDIDMEMCMYIQNYNLDQQFTTNVSNVLEPLRQYPNLPLAGNRTLGEKGDNAIWWLAQHQENLSSQNWNLSKVQIIPLSGAKEYGPITILIRYTPIKAGSAPTEFPLVIKKTKIEDAPAGFLYDVNILATGDGDGPFIIISTQQAELDQVGIGAVTYSEYVEPINPGEVIFNLQRFPLKFTIPSGDYTPGELADIITKNMSNLEKLANVDDIYLVDAATNPATKTNWPAMNPFLTTILKNDADLQTIANREGVTIGQAFVNGTDYTTLDGTPRTGTYYMNYNLTGMRGEFDLGEPDPANFNPPLDKYVGANQVALIFNENTNKLEFNLHFPIYVNASGPNTNDAQPGVLYNSIPNTQPSIFAIPTGMPLRYSGVAFTKLGPTDFWEHKLGFENFTVGEVHNANLRYPTAADPVSSHNNSFTIQAQNGVNITGAFPSLDVGVIKGETDYSVPPFSNGTGPLTAISNPAIWSINSTKTYNNSIADEGYFLVDVSPNFTQNLIGGTGSRQSSKSTQSIVNRYYTQNSFTSDQGQGAIGYTHQGAPQMLSDLHVRVLNPDRSEVDPTILQDKNTVFVEIIKAIK
jgi:hypothetical protein